MYNVCIAFIILEERSNLAHKYKHVDCSIIFDVNIDFMRKLRWVVVGHKSPDLVRLTYNGVASRESVRIAFTYTTLNELDVWVEGIKMLIFKRHDRKRMILFMK